jgi:hypothetical protein
MKGDRKGRPYEYAFPLDIRRGDLHGCPLHGRPLHFLKYI